MTFSSSGGCSNTGATFTMTSGTTACSVKYDQAGNANYNAAREVTEIGDRAEGGPVDHVTTHAPSTAVYGTSFSVAATPLRRTRLLLEWRGLPQHRRHLHDDERHRHLHREVRPGRATTTTTPHSGDRVGDRGQGRPVDHGHHTRSGRRGRGSQFTVAATERAGRPGRLLEWRRLQRTAARRSR